MYETWSCRLFCNDHVDGPGDISGGIFICSLFGSETTLALPVELSGRYLRYISQQSSSTMFVGGMNHSRKQTSLNVRGGGYEQAHGFSLSVVWKS